MSNRILRVWESAYLHGKTASDPAEIVEYRSDEYDAVGMQGSDLVVSRRVEYENGEVRWEVVALVKASLWHKYAEELVEEPVVETPSWGQPDTRLDEPVQPTDFEDLNPVAIGAIVRADDPFPTANYGTFETAVERAEPGMHAAPDEPDRQPGDPVVYDTSENSMVITSDMRNEVLAKLKERVPTIGKKVDVDNSATSTTILGLDTGQSLADLGDTEVFKTIK